MFIIIGLVPLSWNCSDTSRREKQVQEQREADLQAQEERLREKDRQTILTINATALTNGHFKAFIQKQYSNMKSLDTNNALLSRIFDLYVEQELIIEKIRAAEVDLDEVEIKEFLDTLQIDENFQSDLIRDNLIIQKYLYFTLYNHISVSENEIQQYYNKNKSEFTKNDEVLLHQIFVKDKDKSTQIRGILKNFPGRFAETARNQSEAPEAEKNGVMGYYERGTLPQEMENVVFSLNINEISPVVESPYGYHIFKVTKRRSKRTLYLSTVKEEIKKKVMAEKMRTAFNAFLDNLKANSRIKIEYQNLFFEYVPVQGEKNEETS